jgi:transcription termination factor Rho
MILKSVKARKPRFGPTEVAFPATTQELRERDLPPASELGVLSASDRELLQVGAPGLLPVKGIFEMLPQGVGYLRDPAQGYLPADSDPLVPAELAQQYGLRPGALVEGFARPGAPRGQGRARGQPEPPRLMQVSRVEERPTEEYRGSRQFTKLTPVHPFELLRLETGPTPLSTRILDLFVPVGKGQRGLIVAPPRSGKTLLLKEIGQAIAKNHPQVRLVVLLIDERPEEVTDFRRSVPGEVIASNLDQPVSRHVQLAQLVVARCQRLAEQGQDVVLLIDSLTRMARAFNKAVQHSGKTLTGGLDVHALDVPKRLFAAARAFEEGGSLTILATALVETGSRMDDLIFEEFKGTGNLELVLDRRLAEQRIWPAIDLTRSGTRREELLLDSKTLEAVTYRRRNWDSRNPAEIMQATTAQLARFPTNQALVEAILRQARSGGW